MAEVGENKERNSYSVWAIPPDDVSRKLKNLMEGLRAEFGGPQIEPHIPLVGSIRMTREAALQKFRSGPSLMKPYVVKVKDVVNSPSYYQCVNLLFHLSYDESLEETHCDSFDMLNPPLRRLSLLLYGNLTEEERARAQAKVLIMDESIKSLSFPITRVALYEIHYKDKTLQSWEKIAECPLLFN